MDEHEALIALGFKYDETPSEKAIKKAYRAAALKYHPDKLSYPDGATETEKEALKAEQKECFEEISMAYQYLLKPEHEKSGRRSSPGEMTHHEYMTRQYGYLYTRQFDKVYGDKSQKFHVSFSCYIITEKFGMTLEPYNCADFYFDSRQRLRQFCSFLENKVCYKVSLSSESFPKEASSLIVDAIEKNRHIMEVTIYEDFLSPEQHQRLKDILHEKNYPNRLNQSQKKLSESFAKNYSILGALLGSLFIHQSFGIGALCILGGYFVGTILGKLRYKYLDRAVDNCFINEDTTNAKTSPEVEALKIGVMAEKWSGYFSSFTNYATYKHPTYFAAGLKVALDEDEKALPKLKML